MALEPNNVPSIDPANEDSLAGTFRHVLGKYMQSVDGMLPARVIAFNGDRNAPRVTVQPLIALLTTGGQQIARAQIASVPVFQVGAGGFLLSFPITPGDLGWIVASDRDISIFLQSYAESRPQTVRLKNFADAVFIPDSMRGYSIDGADAENVVLQSTDGAIKISLGGDAITLTAPNVAIVSDTLTHNGVNVGDDHVHSASGGTGTGGPPV